MNQKQTLLVASTLGALAVALGAFGAHALQPLLMKTDRLDTYRTAVDYHFYHSLTLLAVGILMRSSNSKWLVYSAWSFSSGVLIFSGSLYVLCFTGITKLGAITPVGGVLFITGWIFFFSAVVAETNGMQRKN